MSFGPVSIAPGQRFHQPDGWNQDQVVTVLRLEEDPMGFPRVVFHMPGGREVSAYAAQIEAAVAGGVLTPADDLVGVSRLEDQMVEKLAS